jgi:hypothetical protein
MAPALANEEGTRTSTIQRVPDPASFDLDVCWEEQWQKGLLAFGQLFDGAVKLLFHATTLAQG